MTTTRTRPTARKPAARAFTLTAKGHAAVWYLEQATARASIVAAACGCCGDVYNVRRLASLEHDHTFVQASTAEEGPANRDDMLCIHCRRDLEARYGTQRPRNEALETAWAFAKAGALPVHLLGQRMAAHDDIQAHQDRADEEHDNYGGLFW